MAPGPSLQALPCHCGLYHVIAGSDHVIAGFDHVIAGFDPQSPYMLLSLSEIPCRARNDVVRTE